MTAKILIIDDEPRAHKVLEKHILKIPQLQYVGSFLKALDAIEFLKLNTVDIILLDITMPEVDGFSFLKMLPHQPIIIFTTAHAEYALESYDYNALDYLKKPVPFDRFLKAINKAIHAIETSKQQQLPEAMDLRIEGREVRIPFNTILYFQSLGNYIKIYTTEKFLLSKITTHEIEKSLPKQIFLRIHKSFIVNRSKIMEVTDKTVMVNNTLLPIGKTFKKYVKDFMVE